MYNGLAYRSTDHQDVVLAKAVAVEDAAFRLYGGDEKNKEYPKKIRSLFQNLKNKTNAELGRSVMAGDISPDRLVSMSDVELLSSEQRKTNELYEKENMKKAQVPMMEKSVTSEFKCSRCGQRKVSYNQAQTRSADEPMTTFCECTVCGHNWKVRILYSFREVFDREANCNLVFVNFISPGSLLGCEGWVLLMLEMFITLFLLAHFLLPIVVFFFLSTSL